MLLARASISLIVVSLTAVAGDIIQYPVDVGTFIARRDGCDHFRGEPPYDEARAKFIETNIIELCTDTDTQLKALKEKYVNEDSITERLSTYEVKIELTK